MIEALFNGLGLKVLERGWLSSNNIVFAAAAGSPATVVDTGYVAHEQQTLRLIDGPVQRVLNTHLHSDHCGGNAALQAAHGCEVWVPEPAFDAVRQWDEDRLSFRATGQRCARFSAEGTLRLGEHLRLGAFTWQVVSAPGHDPDALMFFQRESGVLITADALWESRLPIIFPELGGRSGFSEARGALNTIEALRPSVVIPGHGRPFTAVQKAIQASRQRIDQFERDPDKHLRYAARALTMFHMLENRRCAHNDLAAWLAGMPVLHAAGGCIDVEAVLAEMVSHGLLTVLADGVLAIG